MKKDQLAEKIRSILVEQHNHAQTLLSQGVKYDDIEQHPDIIQFQKQLDELTKES